MTIDPLSEESVRAAVHEAFSHFTPSTEIDSFRSGVRSGARRLRATRWISGAVVSVVVLGGALFASSAIGRSPNQRSASVVAAPPQCPSDPATAYRDRDASVHMRAGSDKSLVPGRPAIGAYCDYMSTVTGPLRSSTSLKKSGTLSGADFTTILSAVRTKLVVGQVGCAPSLIGEHLLLIFRYTSGPDLAVSLDLHGCPGVTNGAVRGMFAPAGQTPSALAALGVDPGATASLSSGSTPGSTPHG
jgi:hypothetical protein